MYISQLSQGYLLLYFQSLASASSQFSRGYVTKKLAFRRLVWQHEHLFQVQLVARSQSMKMSTEKKKKLLRKRGQDLDDQK